MSPEPLIRMDFFLKDVTIGKWKIPFPVLLWFALAAIAPLLELSRGLDSIGNYLLFKQVFWHTLHQQNLYLKYPGQHNDCNHYGPLFSVLIAPFALLPVPLGCFLWCMTNAFFLFFAVKKLPFSDRNKNIILLIGAVEMMTSIHSLQFNPMLTAWIIFSFVLIEKEQDFWAAFFIVAGFLIKLYGIAGIVFFLFSRNKLTFAGSFIFWLVSLFCLPMLISSPAFIVQSYYDWFYALIEKNGLNTNLSLRCKMQDISVMGMIRRIFNFHGLKNVWVLVPAALLIVLPSLRISQYKSSLFRLFYLSVALISVVIFSSSAESPTYVIAVIGVAIWYVSQCSPVAPKWVSALLIFVVVFTSLASTDLFPHSIRCAFIIGYSLKALPCFLVWLALIYQLLVTRFPFNKAAAV